MGEEGTGGKKKYSRLEPRGDTDGRERRRETENKSEENELTKSNTHTQNETNQEKILSYVHRKIFIPITKKLEIKY